MSGFEFFFSPLAVSKTPAIQATCSTVESHDEKNMRLKRPMSPHLTIYQPQLTSMLSLTHRTTGIILASYAMALGFGKLLICYFRAKEKSFFLHS